MSAEYNLCTKCGGVKPTRYFFRPKSDTDSTLAPYPDTGPFPLCTCTTWFYMSEEQKKQLRETLHLLDEKLAKEQADG